MFKKVKEIKSKTGVLHFIRWELFSIPFTTIKVLLHLIDRPDEDKDEHDHPWSFLSLILKGGYAEVSNHLTRIRHPFSIAYSPIGRTHRVTRLLGRTYSLVITWGKRQPWGYRTRKGWVGNEAYRRIKNNPDETL